MMFRREWVWNESKQEYDNLGDLKRDPETGLFPAPSPFPKQLEGKAYWDPYVGLYIINETHINHQTGEVTYDPPKNNNPDNIEFPRYMPSETSPFDAKFEEYMLLRRKYVNSFSNQWTLIEKTIKDAGLTVEWFGVKTSDLPMLLDKMEQGASEEYVMALIRMLTKSNADFGWHSDSLATFRIWRDAFNELILKAPARVKSGDLHDLGYLALPLIYDELKSGGGDTLVIQLPIAADGFNGCNMTKTTVWDKAKWLSWFETNRTDIDYLRYVLEHPLKMQWLEK